MKVHKLNNTYYNNNSAFKANPANTKNIIKTYPMPDIIKQKFLQLQELKGAVQKIAGTSYNDKYYLATRINNSKLEAGLNILTNEGEQYSVKLSGDKMQSFQPLILDNEDKINKILHSAKLDLSSQAEKEAVYNLHDDLQKEIEEFYMQSNLKCEPVIYRENGSKEELLGFKKDNDNFVFYIDDKEKIYYFPNYKGHQLVSYQKQGKCETIRIYDKDFIRHCSYGTQNSYSNDKMKTLEYIIYDEDFDHITKRQTDKAFCLKNTKEYYKDRLSVCQKDTQVNGDGWDDHIFVTTFDREGNKVDHYSY